MGSAKCDVEIQTAVKQGDIANPMAFAYDSDSVPRSEKGEDGRRRPFRRPPDWTLWVLPFLTQINKMMAVIDAARLIANPQPKNRLISLAFCCSP
jgi:hypothetical protein